MWRTLFAIAHADGVVTDEEIRFMAEALEDIPFSDEQMAVLTSDMGSPQDVTEMFAKVDDAKDQSEFFNFARTLVHADGDYGIEEQDVMLKLKEAHMGTVDLDSLIGRVDLKLEVDRGEGDERAYRASDPDGFWGLFRGLFSGRKKR